MIKIVSAGEGIKAAQTVDREGVDETAVCQKPDFPILVPGVAAYEVED